MRFDSKCWCFEASVISQMEIILQIFSYQSLTGFNIWQGSSSTWKKIIEHMQSFSDFGISWHCFTLWSCGMLKCDDFKNVHLRHICFFYHLQQAYTSMGTQAITHTLNSCRKKWRIYIFSNFLPYCICKLKCIGADNLQISL